MRSDVGAARWGSRHGNLETSSVAGLLFEKGFRRLNDIVVEVLVIQRFGIGPAS
jgi:hypothetical protein